MAKVQQKNVAAKLRNKNLLFLFGFFFFGICSYLLLPYYFAAGVLCIVLAGVCVWLLISPTIHYLPSTRHAVVSLDISGASKSIRFVRTNVGSFVPAIYTPKTDKTTIQTSTNNKLQRLDGGTIKVTSDVVAMDRFTYNGLYHKTVLDTFELDFAGAICMYLCVLVRSKQDTIFDAVTLRQYLTFLQPRIFVLVLLVRFVLTIANAVYFSFLLTNRFSSSPTLPIGANNVQTSANTVVVSEKLQSDKEVSYAN
jgi:hypothetical protein